MRTALTIAGSDSSGGAGIQADIKTMTMNGVYAMSAITALTAQNTTGVTAIQESTADFLAEQLDEIFTDIFPDAVKIGMVSSSDLITTIAEKLQQYDAKNIVVDPVMVATSGARLISEEAIDTLKEDLLQLADVITPNIPEAEVLADMSIQSEADMEEAAKDIFKLYGCNVLLEAEVLADMSIQSEADMEEAAKDIFKLYGCNVLLKGGHNLNDANDLLYTAEGATWFHGERIDNPNTHGTGCTLSSAIAANLAKGYDLKEAVGRAKDYISGALAAGLDLGQGSGPMAHNFDLAGKYAEAPVEEPAEPFSKTFDNATGFSLDLMESCRDLWDAAANCDFLTQMGEGTLDHDKFVEYMIQDSIYLRDYLKIFAYAIAKAPNWADMQLFNGMLAYCDDGENKTRLDILASVGMTDADIDKTEMKRQCRDYCAFLKDWGEKGTQAEIIMAMLPCMWGYRYVFEQLVAKHPEALEHPDFGPVIADYVNAGYAWYCDYWYTVTNEKCKAFDDATLAHLKNIFREASAHELWFWQMAGGAD